MATTPARSAVEKGPEEMRSHGHIARYYDRNTPRFLLVGGGGSSHSIHRQLWGAGVITVEDASAYINLLIADEIRGLGLPEPLSVVDMGCGVGGTAFQLAESFPDSRFVGVTISQQQYDIAVRLTAQRNLGDRCRFVRDDFQTIELDGKADVIVAIESFVHSDSGESFFRAATRHLRDGGYLMVADDFLTWSRARLNDAARRHVEDFKTGWRLPSLCTVEECVRAAEGCELELSKDSELSNLIRLGRRRDRAIERLSPLFRRLKLIGVPFFGNMIGGNALQVGLREGFLQYRLLVMKKC